MSNTYRIHGARYLRKYTATEKSSNYAYMADVRKIADTLCQVPWERVTSDVAATNTIHTEEGLDWNAPERDRFDAAEWCAEHSDGFHRAYAQAACYVFKMPDSAVGKTIEKIRVNVTSDPYNPYGARIAAMTSSMLSIPTDCSTVRNGEVHRAPDDDGMGAAPRLFRNNADGTQTWYANSEVVELVPESVITAKGYLFVFVCLENYNRGRDGWIEGSSYIDNDVEITLSGAVDDFAEGELNDLTFEDDSNRFCPVAKYEKGDEVKMLQNGVPMGTFNLGDSAVSPFYRTFSDVAAGRRFPGNFGKQYAVVAVSGTTQTRSGIWYSLDAGLTWKAAVSGPTQYSTSLQDYIFKCVEHFKGDTPFIENGVFIAAPRFVSGYPETYAPWYSTDGKTWLPANCTSRTGANSPWVAFEGFCKVKKGSVERIVGYSKSSGFWYSNDGINWTQADGPLASTDQNGRHYYYPIKKFVAGAGAIIAIMSKDNTYGYYEKTGMFVSRDCGETWEELWGLSYDEDNRYIDDVFFSNGVFFFSSLIDRDDRYDPALYYFNVGEAAEYDDFRRCTGEYPLGMRAVEYGGGKFVAASTGSVTDERLGLCYSSDGVSWTFEADTSNTIKLANHIVCREAIGPYPQIWVVTSDYGLFVSSNGLTWTRAKTGSHGKIVSYDVWGNSDVEKRILVLGGSAPTYSKFGDVWDMCFTDDAATGIPVVQSMCFDGRIWVAASNNGIYCSNDGKSWRHSNTLQADRVWGDGKVFVAGMMAGGAPMYSLNGETWNQVEYKGTPNINIIDMRSSGGFWVIFGRAGMYHSYDGKTWYNSIGGGHIGSSRGDGFVRHGGNTWVAICGSTNHYMHNDRVAGQPTDLDTHIYAGELLYSDDGIAWTVVRRGLDTVTEPIFDGEKWAVVIDGTPYTSLDGKSWAPVTLADGSPELGGTMVYDGRVFVAMCEDGTLARSNDLATWQSIGDYEVTRLFYAGGAFVAFASSCEHIYVSANGIEWQVMTPEPEYDQTPAGVWLDRAPWCCACDYKSLVAFGSKGLNGKVGGIFSYLNSPAAGSDLPMRCVANVAEPGQFLDTQWVPVVRKDV